MLFPLLMNTELVKSLAWELKPINGSRLLCPLGMSKIARTPSRRRKNNEQEMALKAMSLSFDGGQGLVGFIIATALDALPRLGCPYLCASRQETNIIGERVVNCSRIQFVDA